MTQYSNPKVDESVNVTGEHPLKEFFQLLLGVGIALAIVILLVNAFAGTIARQIPFSFEQRMVAGIDLTSEFEIGKTEQQRALQSLADRLSSHMQLPPDMHIQVHYSGQPVVNAFATLGGNVVFFNGLVDKLESEDELAAVMAHEIAHIKQRHPISALGKGMTLGTLAAFVSGASGSAAGEWLIGSSANLGMMKFSRDQERAADLEAAQALFAEYGHIQGADQLFRRFQNIEQGNDSSRLPESGMVELFRSHPYSENRWRALKEMATERDWPTQGPLTPLSLAD